MGFSALSGSANDISLLLLHYQHSARREFLSCRFAAESRFAVG